MHIKCSSKLDKITPDPEKPISQTRSPPKDDTSQDPPNEEDDTGGGNIIYKIGISKIATRKYFEAPVNKIYYTGENAYPDEACESVLVNGISVLLAILETRKAVSNSFVANDYLDACGTGKKLKQNPVVASHIGTLY